MEFFVLFVAKISYLLGQNREFQIQVPLWLLKPVSFVIGEKKLEAFLLRNKDFAYGNQSKLMTSFVVFQTIRF